MNLSILKKDQNYQKPPNFGQLLLKTNLVTFLCQIQTAALDTSNIITN